MNALSASALVVGHPNFRFGPFDLKARAGEILALIGVNGSGKTTLLKTLAGLQRPLEGDLSRTGAAAYLPPPGAVDAAFSLSHVVALGASARQGWRPALDARDYQAAAAALERVGLADLESRAFDQLSTGQQQLGLLARLIVQDAPICLLDEPTASLDPARRDQVAGLIDELAAEGRIVIVATHDLPLAARAHHRRSLVNGGLDVVTTAVCPCCGQSLV